MNQQDRHIHPAARDGEASVAMPETPIADALLRLRERQRISFHGLPIRTDAGVGGSVLAGKYGALFGQEFLRNEMTATGAAFDSFFFPKTAIRRAEALAAAAFGARQTLFVTGGTSVAIQIAIAAMVESGMRVLVDGCCHVSAHFALGRSGCETTYIAAAAECAGSQRLIPDSAAMLRECAAARRDGRPYHVVVLNAASYDGVMSNVRGAVESLLRVDATLSFIIDEAWSAHACFHAFYRPYTAMFAASDLARKGIKAEIVSVQSAHKSLNSLRQGSYIHVFGSQQLEKRIRSARFALHTTSPSYPILASLDLARAQMEVEGQALVTRALALAKKIVTAIREDPALSAYRLNDDSFISQEYRGGIAIDPARISIDLSASGLSPALFKRILRMQYSIYVHRHTPTSVLLNIHIGIGPSMVRDLIDAMKDIQRRQSGKIRRTRQIERRRSPRSTSVAVEKANGTQTVQISTDFVIPYPPGVPVLMPGDPIDRTMAERICAIEESGVEVVRIGGHRYGPAQPVARRT
jgi:arginine/lysine/ornithine decarboxylase